MSGTASALKPRSPSVAKGSAEKIPSLVSKPPSPQSPVVMPQQQNLSSTVAGRLLDLMNNVTKDDVNPETVNAACNCAKEIHKIIRLNLELERS